MFFGLTIVFIPGYTNVYLFFLHCDNEFLMLNCVRRHKLAFFALFGYIFCIFYLQNKKF